MRKARKREDPSGADLISLEEYTEALKRVDERGMSEFRTDFPHSDLRALQFLLNCPVDHLASLAEDLADRVTMREAMWGRVASAAREAGEPGYLSEFVLGISATPDVLRTAPDLLRAIVIIRNIGLRLSRPETPQTCLIVEGDETFVRLRLSHEEALIIVLLANMRSRSYGLWRFSAPTEESDPSEDTPFPFDDVFNLPIPDSEEEMQDMLMEPKRVDDSIGALDLLVSAARGLWPLMLADAQLRRCPAIATGATTEEKTCGRYFATASGRGRPQRYCSETCRKRAHRWRTEHGSDGNT